MSDDTTFETEQAVLSCMLMDPDTSIPRVRRSLPAQAFQSASHRSIVNAIYQLHDEEVTVDPLSLASRLVRHETLQSSGGKDYLGYLIDVVPSSANVEHYVSLVKEDWDRKRATGFLTQALDMLKGGKATPREVAVQLQTSLLPIALESSARGFRWITVEDVEQMLTEVEQRAQRLSDGLLPGLATGYAAIDRETNGFRPGELVVFGGAPKSLKSYLCINILINTALRRVFGGLVSAEMTFPALLERFVTSASLVSVAQVGRGAITGTERERMLREGGRLASWIAVDDEALPELGDVIARCTDLKAQQPKLELMVVDYIQLVQNKLQGRREDSEINGITRALKGTAKRLDLVMIAPAQCNFKEVESRADRMPQLRDFQGASGMAQDPDFAGMLLNRRQYDPSAAAVLEIDFQGARRTNRFTAFLRYDPQSMAMTDEPHGKAA